MSERKPVPTTFLDRAIMFVSPQAGLRRLAARRLADIEFGYNDREWERGRSGGQAKNAASDSYANQRDTIKAMWDARDLARYTWIGSVLGRIVLYVVGELEAKSATGDDALDREYDAYFHNWCGDELDLDGFFPCDVSGRHRLIKLVQLALLAMFVDGDHGLILSGSAAEGLSLQNVEADCIGSPQEAEQREDYFRGVTVDPATGRPQSYRIYRRSRLLQYVSPTDYAPPNFIHLWDPDRVDQHRGVTALLRCLTDVRDLKEWVEAEKIAGKTQSQFAGVYGTKNPYGTQGSASWDGAKTPGGTNTQNAEWGKLLRQAEGEDFRLIAPPSRPSGGFMAFTDTLIRRIAVSLKLTYGFVWDLSTLGGVSQRAEVRYNERQIQSWQRLLVDRVLRRVRGLVLDFGVARQEIPAHPAMGRCNWHFGERVITDVGYEVQNDLMLLNGGLMAADDVAAKYNRGGGLGEIAERNAAAISRLQAISAMTGKPIELLAGGLYPNATAMLAGMNTPPEELAPPPAGSLAAVGEKGAQQIVDILTKVTTGQLDREAAVQTLVMTYGLSPEQAEAITPQPKPQPKPAAKPQPAYV